jgi:RNA polymerase sigma factor for flagellar operon FliA
MEKWGCRLKAQPLTYRQYYSKQKLPLSSTLSSSEREEMILQHTPLIKYIAHWLAMRLPPHISIDDLMSAGMIGLMDALDKFDPGKKVQFKTYAEFRIRGAMLDELRSMDWVSASVRRKAAQLEKAFQVLEKKRGQGIKDMEDEEVAQELGLSLPEYYHKLNEVQGISLLDFGGLREKFSQLPDEDILNLLTYEDENHPLNLLSLEELKQVLNRAVESLPPKEKTVIALYYYEELTLKEIGEVLGVTESRICQIHTKAILKVRSKIQSYMKASG